MTLSVAQSVGVDISKDALDVDLHPAARRRASPMTPKAVPRWSPGWKTSPSPGSRSSRPALTTTPSSEGSPPPACRLVKVNPRQARRFPEAIGQNAKTDTVDAAMLARFAALLEPPVRPVVSTTLDAMKELSVARRALVKDRVAAQNREHTHRSALLKRQAKERLRQIDRQIAAIDAALRTALSADPALEARFDILQSIPGIGQATAFAILIDMPELGAIEPRCAASLAGLAPIARFIRGGRAQLRQALYLPALVAVRFNPPMKAKYEALRAAGKPAKLAPHRDLRKLLILANALLRDGRTWAPGFA